MENKALGHLITQNGVTSLKAKTLKKHFFCHLEEGLKKPKKDYFSYFNTEKTSESLNFAFEHHVKFD